MTFRRFFIIWVLLWIIGLQMADHTQGLVHGFSTMVAVVGALMTLASASFWWDVLRHRHKGRQRR